MAMPLSWLTECGSKKSDGSANAGGSLYLVTPSDPNTRITAYKNADETEAWSQPITLDSAGRVPGTIYVNAQCRVLVYDSTGATVQDVYYEGGVNEGNVEVKSSYFTGSVGTATAAGQRTDLGTVVDRIGASVGGTDGKYKDSSGGTERAVSVVITEQGLSVKSRGAVGNGTTVDTAAFQSAIAILKAAGGGTLIVPPGTYAIDTTLTHDFAGLTLKFLANAKLVMTAQNTDLWNANLAALGSFTIENGQFALADAIAADSTGYALRMTNVQFGCLANVRVTANGSSKRFGRALSLDATCTYNNVLGGIYLGATHAVRLQASSDQFNNFIGGYYDAAGANGAVYADGATYTNFSGVTIQNVTGHAVETANAVTGFVISGVTRGTYNISAGTTGFVDAGVYALSSGGTFPTTVTNAATGAGNYFGPLAGVRPYGDNKGLSTGAVETISGVANFTPDLSKGNVCLVTCNNVAANVTIQVPSGTWPEGTEFIVSVINTAGPIAGAAFAAGYKNLAAVAISLVNGNISTYRVRRMNSQWYITHGVVGTA